MDSPSVLRAAATDAAEAIWNFHDLEKPFACTQEQGVVLLTDVWVFDPLYRKVLLVNHPRRGWVMPGGKVEDGEAVRFAAVRELEEETGIIVDHRELRCVAVTGGARSAPAGLTIGLAYSCSVDDAVPLRPEPDQAARWWSLDEHWPSIYPHDRKRLVDYATVHC